MKSTTIFRRFAALLASASLLVLSPGCSEQGGGDPAPEEASGKSKGVIAVSVLTLTNPFFKDIADAMTEEAAKHGYEVLVTSGEFDVAKQQTQVKDFIVKGVSAIVLCPCDSKAIGPVIGEANAAGIPVFTADIACLAPGVDVVSHVATDNYSGGKQAGEAMKMALGETGGKVVILDYKQAESCILRVKGFTEVLDAYNKGREKGTIDVVMSLPGDGQKDKGYKAAEDAIQAHPDLAGIFAINDPSALGAYAALEKAGKADQVSLVGFDGQLDGKQAIKDGKIFADPIQYPGRIGQQVVQSIIAHSNGEILEKEQLIPTGLYMKADGDKDPLLK
jgi:ribose transport system substrate-binding protein